CRSSGTLSRISRLAVWRSVYRPYPESHGGRRYVIESAAALRFAAHSRTRSAPLTAGQVFCRGRPHLQKLWRSVADLPPRGLAFGLSVYRPYPESHGGRHYVIESAAALRFAAHSRTRVPNLAGVR